MEIHARITAPGTMRFEPEYAASNLLWLCGAMWDHQHKQFKSTQGVERARERYHTAKLCSAARAPALGTSRRARRCHKPFDKELQHAETIAVETSGYAAGS